MCLEMLSLFQLIEWSAMFFFFFLFFLHLINETLQAARINYGHKKIFGKMAILQYTAKNY